MEFLLMYIRLLLCLCGKYVQHARSKQPGPAELGMWPGSGKRQSLDNENKTGQCYKNIKVNGINRPDLDTIPQG